MMAILLIIEGFHLLIYPFAYILQHIYANSIFNSLLKNLLKYTFMTTQTPMSTFGLIAVLILTLIIGFGVIVGIFLYQQKDEDRSIPKPLLAITALIIRGIIVVEKLQVIPISIFLQTARNEFISFESTEIEDDLLTNIQFNRPLEEQSSEYIVCLIISIISLILMYFLSILVIIFSYDLAPRTQVATSYQHHTISLLKLGLKVFMTTLWIFDPKFSILWLYLIGIGLFFSILVTLKIYYPPLKLLYLHYISSLLTFLFLELSIAVMSGIVDSNSLGGTFLAIISSGILWIWGFNKIGELQMRKQLIYMNNYSGTIYMLERFILFLTSENIKQLNHAEFMSTVLFHSRRCPLPNCSGLQLLSALDTRRDLSEYMSLSGAGSDIFKFKILGIFTKNRGNQSALEINPVHVFLQHILDNIMERYGSKRLIKIIKSYYEFYIVGNSCRALTSITASLMNKASFREQFYCFHLRRMIEDSHIQVYSGVVENDYANRHYNVIQAIKYEKYYNKAISCMEETCAFSITFWELFLNENIDNMEVLKIGKKITMLINEIEQYTNNLFLFPQTNYHFLIKFVHFQFFIAHNEKVAFDVIERIRLKSFNVKLRKDNLCGGIGSSNKKQSLKISLETDKLGLITDASYEIDTLLGYSRSYLMGNHDYLLLPDSIKEKHGLWVKNFTLNMKGALIDNKTEVYLKTNRDFYIKAGLTLHIIPNFVDSNFQCLAIFEKYSNHVQVEGGFLLTANKPIFLISDLDGQIFGLSKHCLKSLQMKSNFLLSGDKSYRLEYLVPNIVDNNFFEELTSENGSLFPFDLELLEGSFTRLFQDKMDENKSSECEEEEKKTEKKYAWGRLKIYEYGEESALHMGYKVLQLVLIEGNELGKFKRLTQFQSSRLRLADYKDLNGTNIQQKMYKPANDLEEHSGDQIHVSTDMEEEDEGLIGEQFDEFQGSVSSSVESISERKKLILFKRQLEDKILQSKNISLQIITYVCYIGMLIFTIFGYIYITNMMNMEQRNFTLLEMAAKRLDQGGISIPMVAVIVENFISYSQFIFDDAHMEEHISLYRNYFSTAGDFLMGYHNNIQQELTDDDEELWAIERTPLEIHEMDLKGSLTTYSTDLTTMINILVSKLIPLTTKIAPSWLELKKEYQIDQLYSLRHDLYFQSENGFKVSRILIDKVIQKYIDIFLEGHKNEEVILFVGIGVSMTASVIITIVIFIQALRLLKKQARSLALFAYIPRPKILELVSHHYNFNINMLWANRDSLDTGQLFQFFTELIKSEKRVEKKKDAIDLDNLGINEEEKEDNQDNQIIFQEPYTSQINLKEDSLESKVPMSESHVDVYDRETHLEEEKTARKIKQLNSLNRTVFNIIIVITVFILTCFIGVFFPHTFIVNSFFQLFEESSFLFKALSKRRPYLTATYFLDEMAFSRNDTSLLESDEDYGFNYYYDSTLKFEKDLNDYKKKGGNMHPIFLQSVVDFNDGEKYFDFLMKETMHTDHKGVVEWCTNRFDNLARKGLVSIIMAYISHYGKLNRSFCASNRTFQDIISIISNDQQDDMGWFGYYCAMPGIYYQMNIFLKETQDSLKYFKTLELVGFLATLGLLSLIYLLLFRYILLLLAREINFKNALILYLPLPFIIENQNLQNILFK